MSVRTTFDRSYQELSEDWVQSYWVVGLHPAEEFGAADGSPIVYPAIRYELRFLV